MNEQKARYKVTFFNKINNQWIINKTTEQTLNAHKTFWADAHKYDFSSYHKLELIQNKYMKNYISISPDGTEKIVYELIKFEV